MELAFSMGLGVFALVLFLGVLVVSLLRRLDSERGIDPHWAGTVGVVATPIPGRGVGRVAHFRHGVRASMAARMLDGESAPAGADVVIVDVRDGVALLASMDD